MLRDTPRILSGFPVSSRRKRIVVSHQTIDPSLCICSITIIVVLSGSTPGRPSRSSSSARTRATTPRESVVTTSSGERAFDSSWV